MSDSKILLTKEGLAKLKKEYDQLTKVQRPNVVKEIKRSRELGDLAENGAYTAARDQQSFVEGRVREIEEILRTVEVVSSKPSGTVSIGSIVDLKVNGKIVTLTVVGHGESELGENQVSNESPIGKAIYGKKEGARVLVNVPSGQIEYTIVKIR